MVIVRSLVSMGPRELSVIEGCPFHIGGDCMKFCIFMGLRELSVIVSYPCCWGSDCMKFCIFGTMRTATQETWDIIFTSMDWNLNNVDFREIHVFPHLRFQTWLASRRRFLGSSYFVRRHKRLLNRERHSFPRLSQSHVVPSKPRIKLCHNFSLCF